LSEATAVNYTPVARSFLLERFPKGALHFQRITAADITAFVQRQARLITSKRARLVVTALRSFLRYFVPSRHRGYQLGDVRSHHRQPAGPFEYGQSSSHGCCLLAAGNSRLQREERGGKGIGPPAAVHELVVEYILTLGGQSALFSCGCR
jgi:hypothetical protein